MTFLRIQVLLNNPLIYQQQTKRSNSQRERRRLSPDDPHADHLPVLPGVFPAAHDHECGGRWYHIPLAARHSLHPGLGLQRHKPINLRSHQQAVPRSLRQPPQVLQEQHRRQTHDVGQQNHGPLFKLPTLRREKEPPER